jgi:methionyl-tRNA formyltransferase
MPQETSSFLPSVKSTLRIGFFGTPYLASRVLADLIADPRFEIAFVVTNPDKSIGRSGELQPTPVKKLALERDIPTYTPTKIRDNTVFFEQL